MKRFNLSNIRRQAHEPSGKALLLLVWLIVALMMPNVVLAFTEGHTPWSAAAGVILPLGLYLLTLLFTRRISLVALALLPILALCAVQIVLLYLYGNSTIAVDMFTNIMTTNTTESSELLGGLMPIILLVGLLYAPLLYMIVRQTGSRCYTLTEKARRGALFTGGLLTIVGVQLLLPARMVAGESVVREEIFPANAIHNLDIALRNKQMVRDYRHTSATFDHEAERTAEILQREIYILVIGESSRAANWSLYGYPRTTNPRLSQRKDICLFRNVTTQSNTTHKSVPMMLTSVGADEYEALFQRKGIADIFKSVGFRTCFISTQSPQGAMVDNLAAECDEVIYIGAPSHDEQLLQMVERIVESDSEEDLLFVLHCYGSHFRYNRRYPRDVAHFTPDDAMAVNATNIEALRNSYDNSIIYTDRLLDSIIGYLANLGDCTAMLYCSDHGEDLFDDERGMFLHASPKVTYYQLHVPCLAWFSEEYCTLYPDKVTMARRHRWSPATTAAIFHTLTEIASIRSRYIDPRQSLVSAGFDEAAPRLYLNDHNEALPLDQRIGITDLDQREFLLHGIIID
ncbi:MAG: lipid A phosphoethanolamine transferase [Rikenellaceae bacterium]|nr:lipid A phosphoethanolamine transferase [Rikenellaceae bacterium]